jgi:uncharacterized RDD family membrane protein YckC
VVENVVSDSSPESFPGQRLGLMPSGRGSLASWRTRLTALIVDWAVSMVVAVSLFGTEVVTGSGWRAWMILAVFFVESTLLTAFAGGSVGQLLTRIGVVRLDRRPVGFLRAVVRAGLVCVVIPALVVGPDHRGLHDLVAGTVVLRRR